MFMIRPTCREDFSDIDIDFISEVLGDSVTSRKFACELLRDSESRDIMLDDPRLECEVLTAGVGSGISRSLFYYVLTRHALLRAGLADREIADYLAALLSEFTQTCDIRRPLPKTPVALDHLMDIIKSVKESDEQSRFYLRSHLANYALFLAGVFPEYVCGHSTIPASPTLQYYERMGAINFQVASTHRLAEEFGMSSLYERIADNYHSIRIALNTLGENMTRASNVGDSERRIDTTLEEVMPG